MFYAIVNCYQIKGTTFIYCIEEISFYINNLKIDLTEVVNVYYTKIYTSVEVIIYHLVYNVCICVYNIYVCNMYL